MNNRRNLYRLLLLLALMGLMVAAAATSAMADDEDEDDGLRVPNDPRIAFGSLDRDGNDGTGFDIWTIDPANPTDPRPFVSGNRQLESPR